MVRDILLYTTKALQTPCEEVDTFDPLQMELIHNLVPDMLETMYAALGYGLAANQIGENIRMFVMDPTWNSDDTASRHHTVIINPEILGAWSERNIEEGCLSIPGAYVKNKRFHEVKVRYIDLENNEHEEVFKGMAAYVVQHEMDHLNGRLFIDDFKPLRRQMALDKHKKYMRMLQKVGRKQC